MACQIISYDLRKPGRNYDGLFDVIKSLGDWWHCLESVWIVHTSLTSGQIRDRVASSLDANDKLLVAKLQGDWASRGLDQKCNNWLTGNL